MKNRSCRRQANLACSGKESCCIAWERGNLDDLESGRALAWFLFLLFWRKRSVFGSELTLSVYVKGAMLDQTSASLTTKIQTKTDLYPDSVLCPITRALGELFLEEPSLFDNSEEVRHCLVSLLGDGFRRRATLILDRAG